MIYKIPFINLSSEFPIEPEYAFADENTQVKVKTLDPSSINIDVLSILEGLARMSKNQNRSLFICQELKETLNPDLDDDYVDEWADIWEAFVVSILDEEVNFLIWELDC